jgi:hypothetical protein
VKDFHDAKKEASHIGGAIAYKTLGQYHSAQEEMKQEIFKDSFHRI